MAVEVGSAYVTVWPKMEGSKWASEIEKAVGGADVGSALSKSLNNSALKSVSETFTKISKAGVAAMAAVGTAVAGLAVGGGISRSLKIDEAQMKFDALGMDATAAMKSASDAVTGTRFGLDAAATVAAQFGAAGIQAGDGMTDALKSVTGIATLAGTSMEDIGSIFAEVASRGKLSGEDLLRLNERGVAATQALASSLGVTTAEVQQMVSSGQIDFQTFEAAMYQTFGEAAFKANDTFSGAMANVQAALSRVGQKFTDPALEGLRQVFVALMPAIDAVSAALQPLADTFGDIVNNLVAGVVPAIQTFTDTLKSGGSIIQAVKAAFDSLPGSLQAVVVAAAGLAGVMGFTVLASKVNALAEAFMPLAAKAGTGIATLIGHAAKLPVVGSAFSGLSTSIAEAGGGFKGLASIMSGLAGPVGIVLGIISALAAAFLYLYNTNEPFRAQMQALGEQLMTQLQPAIQTIMTALQQMASAVMPLIIQMLTMLAPIITQIITVLAQLAAAILPPIMALLSALMPIITQVITMVVQLATQLLSIIMPVIQQIVEFITANMPVIQQIVETVMNAILAVVQAVWPVVQQVFETVMNAIMAVVQAVWPVIQSIIETAMNVIQDVINIVLAAINGDWDGVWNGIKQLAQDIWDGIKNIIQTAIDAVKNVIQTVLDTIKGIWESIWNGIKGFAEDVWNAIKSAIDTAINAVHDAIDSALNAIKSTWDSIWSAISSFISDTWNTIKSTVSDGVNNVINFIGDIPGKVQGFFADAGSWLINAGRSIIDGLLNGIKSAVGAVWDFVSGIGAKIASLKGPESYDKKLLIPAGKWIMGSLDAGLKAGMPGVEKTLKSFTRELEEYKFNPIEIESPKDALGGLYDYQSIYDANVAVNPVQFTPPEQIEYAPADYADAIAGALDAEGQLNLYIDGRLVASTIAAPMDAELAMRAARHGRQ